MDFENRYWTATSRKEMVPEHDTGQWRLYYLLFVAVVLLPALVSVEDAFSLRI